MKGVVSGAETTCMSFIHFVLGLEQFLSFAFRDLVKRFATDRDLKVLSL